MTLTCRELVELVTDYFDGVLPPSEAARFEEHIAHCYLCTRYLEQMRVTITTLGRIEEDSISPEAKDALLDAFRDWNAARSAS
jgi:anti-sigma factor RsiW